jgi:diaminohydroxyphosphoribosylaminopyrimidine deaminase/5-amino-6-(5-phosphoribosylamino)uracil reductase
VEGGSITLQKFIDRNLWDEAIIITGAGSLHEGTKAPCAGGNLRDHFELGDNSVTILDNENTFFDFK